MERSQPAGAEITDNATLVLPVVHLNGTSLSGLIEQRRSACLAIEEAIVMLNRAAPHGRDFYPVPGLMEAARAQYERRVALLRGLLIELESEVEQLNESRTR